VKGSEKDVLMRRLDRRTSLGAGARREVQVGWRASSPVLYYLTLTRSTSLYNDQLIRPDMSVTYPPSAPIFVEDDFPPLGSDLRSMVVAGETRVAREKPISKGSRPGGRRARRQAVASGVSRGTNVVSTSTGTRLTLGGETTSKELTPLESEGNLAFGQLRALNKRIDKLGKALADAPYSPTPGDTYIDLQSRLVGLAKSLSDQPGQALWHKFARQSATFGDTVAWGHAMLRYGEEVLAGLGSNEFTSALYPLPDVLAARSIDPRHSEVLRQAVIEELASCESSGTDPDLQVYRLGPVEVSLAAYQRMDGHFVPSGIPVYDPRLEAQQAALMWSVGHLGLDPSFQMDGMQAPFDDYYQSPPNTFSPNQDPYSVPVVRDQTPESGLGYVGYGVPTDCPEQGMADPRADLAGTLDSEHQSSLLAPPGTYYLHYPQGADQYTLDDPVCHYQPQTSGDHQPEDVGIRLMGAHEPIAASEIEARIAQLQETMSDLGMRTSSR
jgi:hypothetical protein